MMLRVRVLLITQRPCSYVILTSCYFPRMKKSFTKLAFHKAIEQSSSYPKLPTNVPFWLLHKYPPSQKQTAHRPHILHGRRVPLSDR